MIPTTDPVSANSSREISKRWTARLVKRGWTPIADVFLEQYAFLKPPLTTPEAMLVIQLMKHKWGKAAPYPAFKTLAQRMGISVTAVRGHARRLQSKGYLERKIRVGNTNRFNLEPLFAALEKRQSEVEKQRKTEDDE